MNYIKIIVVISVLVFVSACHQDKAMSIHPIEDIYAKKNGGIPVKGYYQIDNFIDTKDSIKKVFKLIDKDILPTYQDSQLIRITDKKSNVTFEDGVAWFDKNSELYLHIVIDSLKNYKNVVVDINTKIDGYRFEKENTVSYVLNQHDKDQFILFQYDTLNLKVLQNFLNIITYERRKTRDHFDRCVYRLINQTTQKPDCEIIYINNPAKGLYNVFTIDFL